MGTFSAVGNCVSQCRFPPEIDTGATAKMEESEVKTLWNLQSGIARFRKPAHPRIPFTDSFRSQFSGRNFISMPGK